MSATPSATTIVPHACHRREAGSTAVEFALILPVLVSLLLGIIEIANILRIQFTLDSAATTMARYVSQADNANATDSNYYESDAQAEFNNNLSQYAPSVQQGSNTTNPASPPALTMSPTTRPSCNSSSCNPFLITITYTYQALSPPMQPFFDGLLLTATARKSPEPRGSTTSLASQQ